MHACGNYICDKSVLEETLNCIHYEATIIDKTVWEASTFDVFISSLPSPLIQCCAKLNGFSGKLLSYLPTLNRWEGSVYEKVKLFLSRFNRSGLKYIQLWCGSFT